jgi:hypothetical protein
VFRGLRRRRIVAQSMDRLIIQTGFGPLYLTGRIHTDVRRPALLAMGGIWTPDDFLHELAETFPDHSVVIAPLPGMGGSLTRTFEVASLTRSLDEAIGWLFRDLRVVATSPWSRSSAPRRFGRSTRPRATSWPTIRTTAAPG